MRRKVSSGFTLIELVIGIVVLAVAMMVINTFFLSQSKDALEPVYRLRASQLGQSIMQDILSRAYDEHSDHNGGYYRCGEIWENGSLWYDGTAWKNAGVATAVACSTVDNYGIDTAIGENEQGLSSADHQHFNDVDDFITKNPSFVNAVTYGFSQYNNYAVKIAVSDDNSSGIAMKRIDVTIKTPSNEQIVFSALKGNY